MNNDIFESILLIGRPASGKSEIIDYLNRHPAPDRRRRFHIGDLDVLDDFPMLWAWFEEDAILSRELGQPRLHSDEAGYFLYPHLWHLLIRRLGLEYSKRRRDDPSYHQHTTALIEFARGTEHGGYQAAFQHLTPAILQTTGIVYVQVPFEESLRKNRRRFNPDRPDSILEHGLEDEKLERLYRYDDWSDLAQAATGIIDIQGTPVPFAVFENGDDVTTGRGEPLGRRLEETLTRLWEARQSP